MLVPPTTLRYDTWDALFDGDVAIEYWHNPEPIVVSADLVVRGATRVKAAILLEMDRIRVVSTEEFLDNSTTNGIEVG